jgi:uncharacterized membrane protein
MSNLPFPPSIWILLAPIFLLAIISLLLPFVIPKKERPPDDAWSGPFYSNSEDPSVFVPKRYGIGWTLNFGNPWSWVVLALVLGLVGGPLILSVAFLRHLPK